MIKIALTGGIACGKSLTGEMLRTRGIPVCDTDEIAHEVLEKDAAVQAALIKEFGTDIMDATGQIDRTVLGKKVFIDPDKRIQLNCLTHPAILRRLAEWMVKQEASSGHVVAIIPLLYEIEAQHAWDVVVCVGAPESEQLRRLRERGLTADEAQARIGAQMRLAEKMERADFVIFNCGSKALLEEQVNQVLRGIRGE